MGRGHRLGAELIGTPTDKTSESLQDDVIKQFPAT